MLILYRSMEELKKHLQSYLTPKSGLVGVVLSDREGVPLVRVTGGGGVSRRGHQDQLPLQLCWDQSGQLVN